MLLKVLSDFLFCIRLFCVELRCVCFVLGMLFDICVCGLGLGEVECVIDVVFDVVDCVEWLMSFYCVDSDFFCFNCMVSW